MSVIRGDGQVDTVYAWLPIPLVIEVRDADGRPVDQAVVRVGTVGGTCECIVRGPGPLGGYGAQINVTTDARGRATFDVRLNTRAGPVKLPILDLQSGASDTARFTLLAASAADIYLTPPEKALYPGANYQVLAQAADVFGNIRADPVAYSGDSPGVISVASDGVVTGVAFGTGRILVTSGTLIDTALTYVVPVGEITMSSYLSTPSAIQVVALDGTNRRTLVQTGGLSEGASSWSPDGQTIAYQSGGMWLIPAQGGTSTPLIPAGAPFARADSPQYSADGQWIYFRGSNEPYLGGEIWRIHPDGLGLELVGPAGGPTTFDAFPSPSPDGTAVAFVSDRGHAGTRTIRVLALATGVELEIPMQASTPRYSPDGQWLAVWRYDPVSPTIWLVRPDGSAQQKLSPPGAEFSDAGIAWSPDGAWVIAGSGSSIRMHIMHVATGLSMPLPYTGGGGYPAWRP